MAAPAGQDQPTSAPMASAARAPLALRVIERIRRASWIRSSLVAALLILAAAALDLRILRQSTLWVDELFSLAVATGHSVEHSAAEADPSRGDFVQTEQPVPLDGLRRYVERERPPPSPERIVRAVALSDTNPPLYYLLLNRWTRLLGTTDGALRAFSVGWFLACIPIVVALARRLGGPEALLTTGLLFVFSPIAVYYSTEGRMYSLLWFWVVAVAWLTLLLRDRPRSPFVEVEWIVASVGGLLTHYFFIFPWSAMLVFLGWRSGNTTVLRVAIRAAVVGLLVLPWYRRVPATLAHWRVTQDWLSLTPGDFSRPRAALELATQFFSGNGHYLWWDNPVPETIALSVFVLLGLVAIFQLRRKRGQAMLLPGLWFAAACVGPLVFDLARHTYTVAVPRYAISALPAAALLGGLALNAFGRAARFTLLAVILGAWSFNLRNIDDNPSRDDQPFWKLGQLLSAETTADDLILVQSIPTGVIGVARYTQSAAPIAAWVEQLGTLKTPESLLTLAQGRRRIFFIKLHTVGAPTPVEDWLRAHARIERESRYGLTTYVVFNWAESEPSRNL